MSSNIKAWAARAERIWRGAVVIVFIQQAKASFSNGQRMISTFILKSANMCYKIIKNSLDFDEYGVSVPWSALAA